MAPSPILRRITPLNVGVLYQHAANIGITCIAYSEQRCLLITADESGRVMLNKVMVSQAGCEVVNTVAEMRSQESLTALLLNASGTRILTRARNPPKYGPRKERKSASRSPLDDGDDRPSSATRCIRRTSSLSAAKTCTSTLGLTH